jgi:hypothetical protein
VSRAPERILLASPGGWEAPSARYRLGAVARSGRWQIDAVSASSLPRGTTIEHILERADRSTALVLQRAMPSPEDMRRLRTAFGALLFDIDDAIYATPPSPSWTVAEGAKRIARLLSRGSTRASKRRRPLMRTLRDVDVAIVGNEILGTFAARFAPHVVEIPSTVEPVTHAPATRPEPPVVTWMGLPDNLIHLGLIRPALERLRREIKFTVRIVSSERWACPSLEVEFVEWSEAASREALLSSTVGVAPLTDDPWTRGKCALRSIQYGGHALPTVASPVGITHQVVRHGSTGYLAATEDEWVRYLRALLSDPGLASTMGEAALDQVRASYSDRIAVERWSDVFESL